MPRAFLKVFPVLLLTFFSGVLPAFSSDIKLVEWRDLSDTDIGPNAKAALSFEKDTWKHAETEHFAYHFKDPKEAETVYIYAEHYYQWIKKFFKVEEDRWKKKGHVFVFENENVWKEFLKRANPSMLEAGGFTDGWELFMYRNPFWLAPRQVLAHELTHIILFRFLEGPIPLFLNEGFADYVSFRAISTQFEGNEYNVRLVELVPPDQYIPLQELAGMTYYPQTRDGVINYYRESELLVRYLVTTYGNEKFYSFLHGMSTGETFKKMIQKTYELDLRDFEEKFKAFAIVK